MTSLMLLAVELALAGAPRPVHAVHPVHAPNVRAPVFAHSARPAPPPGQASSGTAHPAAPMASSNRPPAQGSRAQPGTCRDPGHHHPDRDGDRQPGGWAGPWAPPGPYGYGAGSDYGYGADVDGVDPGPSESWDTPVDATDGWSDAAPPPQDDAAPPQDDGAAQPQDDAAAPPPSVPAAADDGCTETEDTDVDDSQGPAIYQWVDAQGALHFSDYDLIPPAARATAVRTSGDPIVVTHKHLRCGPAPGEPSAAQAP